MKLNTVIGDLFTSKDCLAHCVSKDMRMGKGIAVNFKNRFGQIDELIRQHKSVGECAVIKSGNRYIYYLVTKTKYYFKPTYDDLENSVIDMKKHIVANGINKLSIPLIGCVLDK